MKKGFFYGKTPEIFGWCGFIFHNILIVSILMAKGYGFIDVSMRAINSFLFAILVLFVGFFNFLNKNYQNKYSEFEKNSISDYQYSNTMQILFCFKEYATSAMIVSVFWTLIFFN